MEWSGESPASIRSGVRLVLDFCHGVTTQMSDVSDEAFMKLGGLVWPWMLEFDSYLQMLGGSCNCQGNCCHQNDWECHYPEVLWSTLPRMVKDHTRTMAQMMMTLSWVMKAKV